VAVGDPLAGLGVGSPAVVDAVQADSAAQAINAMTVPTATASLAWSPVLAAAARTFMEPSSARQMARFRCRGP
jgi:hypothetical protein